VRARTVTGGVSALHHLLMVVAAAFLLARSTHDLGVLVLAALLAGWVTLSLVAYSIHRFVFHGRGPLARGHAHHHLEPLAEQTDAVSFFGPIAIIAAAWLLVAGVGAAAAADGIAAGGCLGYSWFRLVHRLVHVPGRPAFFCRYRAFHQRHHASPGVNFGVTTRAWDRLFGTHAQSRPARQRSIRAREHS